MNNTNKILAALLAVQAVLVVVMWATGGGEPRSDARPLLSMSPDSVTELTIAAPPGEGEEPGRSVTLKRNGENWVVSSAGDYPAKTDKVREVVDKLVAARVREPVATQQANHSALRVSAKEHDKQVTVIAGDQAAQLWVGSGKGSSIYARLGEAADVFLARGVSAFALSDRASTYVDTQYIKVEEPTRISVTNPNGALNLTRSEAGVWLVSELPSGAKTDEGRLNAFVSAARSVQLAEPVGREIKPEFGLDRGTRVEVEGPNSKASYTIGALANERFYVKADDNDFVVQVSKWAVESLVTQRPEQFIKQDAPPADAGGAPPGFPGGLEALQGLLGDPG